MWGQEGKLVELCSVISTHRLWDHWDCGIVGVRERGIVGVRECGIEESRLDVSLPSSDWYLVITVRAPWP